MVATVALSPGRIALALAATHLTAAWQLREAQARTSPGLGRLAASLPGMLAPAVVTQLVLDPDTVGILVTFIFGASARPARRLCRGPAGGLPGACRARAPVALGHAPPRAALTAGLVSIVSTLKAVGAAMNRGPLAEGAAREPMPLVPYVAACVLPINAFHPSTDTAPQLKPRPRPTPRAVLAGLLVHAAALVAAAKALVAHGDALPPLARRLLQAVALHCALVCLLDGSGLVAAVAVDGLECGPHHDLPLLATGVAPFWSRWNLVVGDLLRAVVFEPVSEGRAVRRVAAPDANGHPRPRSLPPAPDAGPGPAWPPPAARRALGAAAAFAVSGLVHEAFFWHLTGGVHGGGGRLSGALLPMCLFFAAQSVVVPAERWAKRRALEAAGVPGDHPAWWLWAFAALMGLGSPLFLAPLEREGITPRFLGEVVALADAAAGLVRGGVGVAVGA